MLSPIVKLIWIKKVEGLENIPKNGSCIVAANHSSYFDFISLIAILPRRVYFLAGEVFLKKWWWYPLVKSTGQIMVDRKNSNKEDVYKKVFSILDNGKILGIFPEGTRSADGKIGKTFTGVAKIAIESKSPVVPIGIIGAYEIMNRRDKWPKFKKNIEIKMGKPIYFERYYEKNNDETILREAKEEIMKQIERLFCVDFNKWKALNE